MNMGNMSGCHVRISQVAPLLRQVGAKILAADDAACGPLDVHTALRWHSPLSTRPLVDEDGRNADFSSEIGLLCVGEDVFVELHDSQFSATLTNSASVALVADSSGLLCNSDMTNDEIRRANLITLIAKAGGVGKCADALGLSSSQVSQWKNGSPDSKTGKKRTIGDDSARKIEIAFGVPRGWLDQDHSKATSPHQAAEEPHVREFEALSQEEAVILADLRDLADYRRADYAAQIAAEAAKARFYQNRTTADEAGFDEAPPRRLREGLNTSRRIKVDGPARAARTKKVIGK